MVVTARGEATAVTIDDHRATSLHSLPVPVYFVHQNQWHRQHGSSCLVGGRTSNCGHAMAILTPWLFAHHFRSFWWSALFIVWLNSSQICGSLETFRWVIQKSFEFLPYLTKTLQLRNHTHLMRWLVRFTSLAYSQLYLQTRYGGWCLIEQIGFN